MSKRKSQSGNSTKSRRAGEVQPALSDELIRQDEERELLQRSTKIVSPSPAVETDVIV